MYLYAELACRGEWPTAGHVVVFWGRKLINLQDASADEIDAAVAGGTGAAKSGSADASGANDGAAAGGAGAAVDNQGNNTAAGQASSVSDVFFLGALLRPIRRTTPSLPTLTLVSAPTLA